MRKSNVLALFVLLWTLAYAQPAQAQSIDWMPTWKAAGIEFWGHGRLPINSDDGEPCPDIYFSWGTLEGDDFGMLDSPCHILFSKRMWNENPDPGMRCIATMHEIGHAYGRSHTRRGIMSASLNDAPPWFEVKPCKSVMRFGWVPVSRTESIWSEVPR